MFGETDYTLVDCIFKKSTERAILINIEGTDYWIPKSCLEHGFEAWSENEECEISIAEWVLVKNGIL